MDQPTEPVAAVAAPVIPAPPPRRLPSGARLILGIFVLFAICLAWEVFTSFVAITDDAYVRSDLVAIAPQVSGPIIEVAVHDNQPVHRGDLLARIDPTPFQLAVDAASAALAQAESQARADQDSVTEAQDNLNAVLAALTNAQARQSRALALAHAGYASAQSLDTAIAGYTSTAADVAASRAAIGRAQTVLAVQQAAISQAIAQLKTAQWQRQQTSIFAPLDGTVNNLTLQPGDTATIGKPVIGIIDAHDWRIIANYKQSYLSQLHPGATAWVRLDTHPWRLYRARIRGIARGIARNPGDVGLLPYVAPTTDWIRLQHRFPVTIDLVNPPPDLTFYMGADASCLVFN
jgi:multidrug efflux system membrane fusion protein